MRAAIILGFAFGCAVIGGSARAEAFPFELYVLSDDMADPLERTINFEIDRPVEFSELNDGEALTLTLRSVTPDTCTFDASIRYLLAEDGREITQSMTFLEGGGFGAGVGGFSGQRDYDSRRTQRHVTELFEYTLELQEPQPRLSGSSCRMNVRREKGAEFNLRWGVIYRMFEVVGSRCGFPVTRDKLGSPDCNGLLDDAKRFGDAFRKLQTSPKN